MDQGYQRLLHVRWQVHVPPTWRGGLQQDQVIGALTLRLYYYVPLYIGSPSLPLLFIIMVYHVKYTETHAPVEL